MDGILTADRILSEGKPLVEDVIGVMTNPVTGAALASLGGAYLGAKSVLSGNKKKLKKHKLHKKHFRKHLGKAKIHKMRKKHFGTSAEYKRKGGKSVHYTKHGQPYIIVSGGKARFIKKSKKAR